MMDPAGGTSYVEVASINAWDLSMKRDRADATAFGDTNKVKVLGLPDFTGTIGGLWDATDISLFTAALGTTAVHLKLLPDRNGATHYFHGLAYLDASISVKNDGVVGYQSTFDAAGNWALV